MQCQVHIALVEHYVEPLPEVTISMCYLSKVPWLFPCSSKSFLNVRRSSTRLLIN